MCNLKANLRKEYLIKRKILGSEQILTSSKKIAENFLNSPFAMYDLFGVFLTLDKKFEVDTRFLIDGLERRGKTIGLPVIKNSSMDFVDYKTNRELVEGFKGILEPKAGEIILPEVVITPLIITDKHGYRVGYGKGYYDFYFKHKNTTCLKVGVNFFPSIDRIEDIHSGDVPLDYLITPEKIESFSANFIK